jgi:hypothetical protein
MCASRDEAASCGVEEGEREGKEGGEGKRAEALSRTTKTQLNSYVAWRRERGRGKREERGKGRKLFVVQLKPN